MFAMRIFNFLLFLTTLVLPGTVFADSPKTSAAIQQNQETYRENGTAGVIVRPTIIRYPFGEGTPTIQCAVMQACEVSFLPGDVPVNRTIGDREDWPTAWWVGVTPQGPVYHMVFKPYRTGIMTNIIIGMSNSHSYDFYVQSVPAQQLRVHFYSFYDPGSWATQFNFPPVSNPYQVQASDQQKIAELKKEVQKAKQNARPHGLYIDPREVESLYRVKGHASWKPVAVFDDKVRVFIQFPASVESVFRPAFFQVSRDGKLYTDMVKRVSSTMLVVPHLFRHGALVWGIGDERKRIDIYRLHKHNKKHWWNPF